MKKPDKNELLEIENLYKGGQFKVLEKRCDILIKKYPNFFVLFNINGVSLVKQNKFDQAIFNFKKAIEINPNFFEAYNNLGNTLMNINRYEEAISNYKKAIEIKKDYAEAYNNLGTAFRNISKFDDAIKNLNIALKINPNYAEAYSNLANVYDNLENFFEAVKYHKKSIELKPNNAELYNNIGISYDGLGKFDEAILNYKKAIELKPDYAEAYSNLGNVYDSIGKFDDAIASHRKALEIKPDFHGANWYESYSRLKTGQFEIGWQKYEYRWFNRYNKIGSVLRHTNIKPWRGKESISNKQVLVWAEQGYGDVMQFSRYLPKLIDLKANITFEVLDSIKTLVETISNKIEVVSMGKTKKKFDFQVPLLSLPLVFKTTLKTIPNKLPYFKIPEKLINQWKKTLGPKKKLRIGLTWSGNKNYRGDYLRSPKLVKLLPLISNEFDFYCLQKDIRDQDKEEFKKSKIIHVGNNDFLNIGAIIKNLDLVISSDTSIAHLAGSLNFPTWLLLTYSPDWRWMMERNDTPWYPSMKLFRQKTVNDWDTVIIEVINQLKLLNKK